MTRKTITLALLAALCAAALAGFGPAAAAAGRLPRGFVGISPQSTMHESDYELMHEAGIESVRLPLMWLEVQPNPPSVAEPDWSNFDREVELAAEAGLRILPCVFGTPRWAGVAQTVMPVRSAWQRWGWSSFLRAAARRYGRRGSFWRSHPELPYLPVRRWEVWNEENIVTYARPSPVRFARLIRISGRILHRFDRGSKVILGGLFGRPLQIPPNVGSGEFLNRFYRVRNVKQYFDGVALHPYVARARAMAAQLANLRRIIRLHHDARTPIYVTELGWGSADGPTRWQRGIWGQADQLSRSLAIIAAHRRRWRIGGVWWFTWSDEGGSCSFCGSAGLLTASRDAKPSWYRFNSWTGGDPDTVPRAVIGAGGQLEAAEPAPGETASPEGLLEAPPPAAE